TYRLQLSAAFGFREVAQIVPYLRTLGISHLYLSPIFRARPGSRHGYDGLDPNQLNPELGSADAWRALLRELKVQGMGLILDIVPNHLAYHPDNPMLRDIFEHGRASLFRGYFDICWNHPLSGGRPRVAAPFLGRRYAACLKGGEIRLALDARGFSAAYGDLRFPLRLETYLTILNTADRRLKTELGREHSAAGRWIDLLDQLESLPLVTESIERRDQARTIQELLWELYSNKPPIRRALEATLAGFNTPAEDPARQSRLDRLLARQHFRLCHWKTANQEINYRRFFDINELIALRQEEKGVFRHAHRLLGRLAETGAVSGVRVDHVDGLAAPGAYLDRLRQLLGPGVYIVVEKILASPEALPAEWPVQGTTGYDFGHWLNGLFVRRENGAAFSELYARFSGHREGFGAEVCKAKTWVLTTRLAGDLDNLTYWIKALCARTPLTDALTFRGLKAALAEVLARLGVYRTYLESGEIRPWDRSVVEEVLGLALHSRPSLQGELEFIRRVLLEHAPQGISGLRRRAVVAFQQLSAALTAKGLEDTALYRYPRLLSLNEVGGDPAGFGCRRDQFHQFMARRAKAWPQALNATATHDGKRGEDARARINVLSEMPLEWEQRLNFWHGLNAQTTAGPEGQLDKNTEYLLYQTLIGAWPGNGKLTDPFAQRIQDYMRKAVREAGAHTSWLEPRESYEKALAQFVHRVLEPSADNAFLADFGPFCQHIAALGLLNSLSQCLLKIAAPGVPDFYQGSELW
ncbi:MAG: malto-oligosyltrehalose synthase, partial [Desulfobacterales bacterium]